jgi:hypothetical protein
MDSITVAGIEFVFTPHEEQTTFTISAKDRELGVIKYHRKPLPGRPPYVWIERTDFRLPWKEEASMNEAIFHFGSEQGFVLLIAVCRR